MAFFSPPFTPSRDFEFDHVFLLGEGWQNKQDTEMEEERRLYYVGMSRARETLHLFNLPNSPNPHAASLTGDFLFDRKTNFAKKELPVNKQYTLLGMGDLFVDFAGIRNVNHPVRRALQKLHTGDRLQVEVRNGYIELVNHEGISVARLSRSAQGVWKTREGEIREGRVVAMVRRYKEDISDTIFKKSCYGEKWEVPVVELCC
ncbi:MAG: hypothetical protein GY799_04830 [Desulfobulbaceae bacterium]|nr:hypothetical protein [Desulfobulbaceae bacterium]